MPRPRPLVPLHLRITRSLFRTSKAPPLPVSGGEFSVALVSDFVDTVGGVERHIECLAECYARCGLRVVVITKHEWASSRGLLPRYERVHTARGSIDVYRLGYPNIAGSMMWFPGLVIPKMARIFKRHRVAVVHGHQTYSTLAHVALWTAGILGIHRRCFTDHSFHNHADFFGLSIMARMASLCTSITAPQIAALKDTYLRSRGDVTKYHVVPNGALYLHDFHSPSCGGDLVASGSGGRAGGAPIVAFVGRLTKRKGADILAKLLPILLTSVPCVTVHIFGDGPLYNLIEASYEQHTDDARTVVMHGSVSHARVLSALSVSDILLQTSRTESFNISVVEALSAGVRVVATDVGVAPADQRFAGSRAVRVVPGPVTVDLARDLSLATVELLNQRPLSHYEHNTLKLHIKMQYTLEACAHNMLQMYRNTLKSPHVHRELKHVEKNLGGRQISPLHGFILVGCGMGCVWCFILWVLRLGPRPSRKAGFVPDSVDERLEGAASALAAECEG